MKKWLIGALLAATGLVMAGVNYPYPQNSNYGGRGIRVQNASTATIKSKFTSWLANFYVEQGSEARIKFDDPTYTVSEGIGYAMLALVYLADASTADDYQGKFDKLWTYYKNRRNNNGLMNWKIQGFSTSCSDPNCNGATDGDLDVALALLMASYQFTNPKTYRADAQELIGRIRAYEIENSSPYLLRPGDAWNSKYNPSYFSPAHMEVFKALDAAGASKWTSAITDNYTMLAANQHATTGLHSDWCNANGSVNGEDKFGYEAVRIPWRLVMDYYWHGRSQAKTQMDKMGSWVVSKTGGNPGSILSEYNRSTGNSIGSYASASFVGAFATSTATNAANQSFLNSAFTTLMSFNTANEYYHGALQVLNALLITGNMPNLANMSGTSSSSVASSSSTTGAATDLIDNLEDGDYKTLWGGEWYTYNDNAPTNPEDGQGASTVTPLTSKDPKVYFTPTAGGATGSTAYSAKITFTLNKGTFKYTPFVGIGLNLRADEGFHDLSSCTEIEYKYIGYAHRFRVESQSVTNYNYHGFVQPAATSWTTVRLGFNDLLQENWGPTSPTATLDKKGIKAFSWQVQDSSGRSGSLTIDDVKCYGGLPGPITSSSSGTVVSSSSRPLSSSALSSSSRPASSAVVSSSSLPRSSSSVATSSGAISSSGGSQPLTVSGFGIWGVFVDSIGSTVTPPAGSSPLTTENGITVAKATMTIKPEPVWDPVNPPASSAYPYVGMLMLFNSAGTAVNLSTVTSISLTYKSTGNIRMALNQTGVPSGQEWGIALTPSASFTTVNIPISSLKQPDWVSTATPIKMNATTSIKWELKEPTGGSGSITISGIVLNGYVMPSSSSQAVSSSTPRSSSAIARSSSATTPVLMAEQNGGLKVAVGERSLGIEVARSGGVSLEIRDLHGRVLLNSRVDLTSGFHRLPMPSLQKGVYVVRVYSGGQIASTVMKVK